MNHSSFLISSVITSGYARPASFSSILASILEFLHVNLSEGGEVNGYFQTGEGFHQEELNPSFRWRRYPHPSFWSELNNPSSIRRGVQNRSIEIDYTKKTRAKKRSVYAHCFIPRQSDT